MENHYRRIGICGGTFDPIHVGHLLMAEYAKIQFDLEKVLFIPTGKPPHKISSNIANVKHRLQMVKLAIQDKPDFEVCDIEVIREGYSYSIDTLRQLKTQYGDIVKFYFIVGADVVMSLTNWKAYEDVFSLCDFIGVIREGFANQNIQNERRRLHEIYGVKIHLIEFPVVEISSTEIRNRSAKDISIQYMVPKEVEEYIIKHRIYKGEEGFDEEFRHDA